uniref:TGF-beta family profile domain-containing protein n=1 Tax=Trichuris muris TaxID=70415 RepID=A0A5S6Q0Y4_TRIMR
MCPPTPRKVLLKVLGEAYNERYMSVDAPQSGYTNPKFGTLEHDLSARSSDRAPSSLNGDYAYRFRLPFHVEPDYQRMKASSAYNEGILGLLGEEAAHKLNISSSNRAVAQLKPHPDSPTLHYAQAGTDFDLESSAALPEPLKLPWTCDERVEWLDLGPNYFPRFLRNVSCLSTRCFYGHYRCKPRAFTVILLRKAAQTCVPINSAKLKELNLPVELLLDNSEQGWAELWLFNEVAVNFSCHCSV